MESQDVTVHGEKDYFMQRNPPSNLYLLSPSLKTGTTQETKMNFYHMSKQ